MLPQKIFIGKHSFDVPTPNTIDKWVATLSDGSRDSRACFRLSYDNNRAPDGTEWWDVEYTRPIKMISGFDMHGNLMHEHEMDWKSGRFSH